MALRSLVICHAPADEKAVRDLAEYLTLNLSVEISFDNKLPLIGAVERGLSAPFALAMFSPDSVPKTWSRAEWEGAFMTAPEEFGSQLGFALLRDCKFPEVLRRERFFDFAGSPLEASRLVRQWLMRPKELPRRLFGYADLRETLVDRPGSFHNLDSTSGFPRDLAREFEQVCRINAQGRTVAGLIGETGHQLGLLLPDNTARNRERLVEYLAEHRVLLIFDHLRSEDIDMVGFGGLSTVITTTGLSPLNAAPVPKDLRDGWELCEFLAPLQRHAEKIEVLEWMSQVARAKGDAMSLYRINHELFFMRDDSAPDDEIVILPTAATDAGQLSLF